MERKAWSWLEPTAPDAGEHAHVFCGQQRLRGGRCPNCAAALLLYASFDARDARLGLAELGLAELPCLFCWRCELAQAEFQYRLLSGGGLEILRCARGPVQEDFPYEDYPDHFPRGGLRLVRPSREELDALARVRDGALWHDLPESLRHVSIPRHRFGDKIPMPLPTAPGCSICSAPTTPLAAFGDSNFDPRGFTGNDQVQLRFFLCRPCAVVVALQSCD